MMMEEVERRNDDGRGGKGRMMMEEVGRVG